MAAKLRLRSTAAIGHVVDRWYDRSTRSWVVQLLDVDGYQIGDAVYVYSEREAKLETARLGRRSAPLSKKVATEKEIDRAFLDEACDVAYLFEFGQGSRNRLINTIRFNYRSQIPWESLSDEIASAVREVLDRLDLLFPAGWAL